MCIRDSNPFIHIVRFVVLILLQVLLLNDINFLGYINPYLYILFIILLPAGINQTRLLFFSFLLGITVDMFEDSGGMHACACLLMAYVRPLILRFSFGLSYDYQTLKFSKTPFGSRLTYITLMVLVHHLTLFSLEIFNASHILSILKNTLFSGVFSILVIIITTTLFSKKRT